MKKKVLSLLLAVVMTFSLAVTANAAEETAQDLDGDIVILHTNDVHCAVGEADKTGATPLGYSALASYVADRKGVFGSGNVTLVNTFQREAPMSRAASSSEGSMFFKSPLSIM